MTHPWLCNLIIWVRLVAAKIKSNSVQDTLAIGSNTHLQAHTTLCTVTCPMALRETAIFFGWSGHGPSRSVTVRHGRLPTPLGMSSNSIGWNTMQLDMHA